MLIGKRQGIPLTLALATTLWTGLVMATSARADGMLLRHTIPREVDAYDFRTGKPYMAPPIPYGHYAKDYVDEFHKCLGCATCQLHGLMGGHGCGHGGCGHGLGFGHGSGCGHGSGLGHETGTDPAEGAEIGYTAGSGLLGHSGTLSSGTLGTAGTGIFGAADGSIAGAAGYATTWAQPSSQVGALPSSQSICGQAGCNISTKHSHLSSMLNKIRCMGCGGLGCGACAGTGATGLCGDPGCSLGAGHSHGFGSGHGNGAGCSLCGGRGCAHCLSGLGSGLHGKLASLTGILHKPKISWFNGAGGPVPITPGYVPYIVTTRSPRDFFSFAPMNPNDR